jgi:hypothetical protein
VDSYFLLEVLRNFILPGIEMGIFNGRCPVNAYTESQRVLVLTGKRN